jgi:hypothetical protein
MNEPAFAAAGAPAPAPAPRGRSGWVTAFFALLLVGLVAFVALALTVNVLGVAPISVSVDGEEIVSGLDLAGMPPAHKVLLAAVILLALLAALVVVPIALVVAMVALVFLVLAVVAIPLLVVVLLAAVLLSPLWLLVWMIWKAVAG